MTAPSVHDFPDWLIVVSWLSLIVALVCAVIIAVDVLRRPQPMAVMALVWPICALFGSAAWLAAYLLWGRAPGSPPAEDRHGETGHGGQEKSGQEKSGHGSHGALGMSPRPRTRAVSVFTGTSHCGAGCTLADIIVEW